MTVSRRLRTVFGLLLALQAATALVGIAALERMSPAIGDILEENVVSVEAVESMMGALARRGGDREAFLAALATAEGNVTEDEERPLLSVVRRREEAAMAGDERAREEVTQALVELGAINRVAMQRADDEARRLGIAGRWALAIFALVGLALVLVAVRRTHHRLLVPLADLVAVTHDEASGDRHRRCRRTPHTDVGELAERVNALIDRAHARDGTGNADRDALLRAVAFLLDLEDGPRVLLGADGQVVATSRSAMGALAEGGDSILGAARAGDPHESVRAVRGEAGGFRLLELEGAPQRKSIT